jgi:hypothetical protein
MLNVKPLERDDFGLLKGVEYVLNKDGGIDWRKMVKPEFLVFNLQHQEKIEEVYGKPIAELTVSEVDDKYLLILLGGIKELARLRGYSSVIYKVKPVNELFVSASCEIDWIPNFETEFRKITFGDAADATQFNTDGFAKSYLTAIATNRAFVRAVKNFLGINILGKDEIPEKGNPQSPQQNDVSEDTTSSSPHVILQRAMTKYNITFDQVKSTCLKNSHPTAEKWDCVYDIDKQTVFDILGRIHKKHGK